MKRLLTLMILALALFMTQPAQAQQQDTQKGNMKMMQDSTMMKNMMQKMMENPQMHKKMMRMMMQNMKSDSTRSGMQGMMGGGICMKMCMNMMNKKMDGMDMNKDKMKKDNDNDTAGYKDEEERGLN